MGPFPVRFVHLGALKVSVESVGQGFTLPMSVYTVVPTGVSSYTCKHNHLTLYQFKKKHMCFKMQRTMHRWMLCD